MMPDLEEDHRPHPVRQDIVDQIKSKTNNWTPTEVNENRFKDATVKQVFSSMGGLDAIRMHKQKISNSGVREKIRRRLEGENVNLFTNKDVNEEQEVEKDEEKDREKDGEKDGKKEVKKNREKN